MSGFVGALQFLTRIPIRTGHAVPHARVVPWFPIVGVLIGVLVGGAAAGLAEVLPAAVAAACAVTIGLLVTGAFHEDGLADVADAFGGGWTRDQRFEILKDSRHGTYGVAALAASIVVRVLCVASLAALAPGRGVFVALVAAHGLARGAAVVALVTVPPARDSGLGAGAARDLRPVSTALGLTAGWMVCAALAGWWLGPWEAAALVAASLVAVGACAALALRKLGGLVGDVLGATEQVAEALVLVVATGLV